MCIIIFVHRYRWNINKYSIINLYIAYRNKKKIRTIHCQCNFYSTATDSHKTIEAGAGMSCSIQSGYTPLFDIGLELRTAPTDFLLLIKRRYSLMKNCTLR